MALMKKILSISLICLMLGQSAMLLGMELDILKNDSCKVVKGLLSIKPRKRITYQSFNEKCLVSVMSNQYLEKVFNKKFEKNDPLIEVCVCNDKCDNWVDNDYCRFSECFPEHFPLSLIIKQEEDEILKIKILDLEVELKCNQLRYGDKPFQDVLKELQEDFSREPKFLSQDKIILEEKGILVKKWFFKRWFLEVKKLYLKKQGLSFLGILALPGPYVHGPNGFHYANSEERSFLLRWFPFMAPIIVSSNEVNNDVN